MITFEIAIPTILIDFQDENVYRAHVKQLLKDNLKIKFDADKKGIQIDFNEALTSLSQLQSTLLFACENMFIMEQIINKLTILGEALHNKYGKEKADEIIQLFNTFVLNDIFDRIQVNNEIIKNFK